MKKIIGSILLIFIIIVFCTGPVANASLLSDSVKNGKSFLDSSSNSKSTVNIDEKKFASLSNDIYRTLLIISFVVVAVIGIVLGIKFMLAGVEEKADVKKSLIVFLIGAGVAYGAFGIWSVVVNALNKF